MKETERKTKISLEDLLQLKRAERPSAEFWPRFEQELRTKQLAALVQPVRPWWQSLVGRRMLVRVYAPLGAAAVVALSLGLSQRSPGPQVALVQSGPNAAPIPVAVVQEAAPALPVRADAKLPEFVVSPAEMPVVAGHEAKHEAVAEPTAVTNERASSPEQLLIAGTATVKAAGQALAQMVGLTDGNSGKTELAQNNAVEPLTQLSTPRDNRRARLLAYSVAYDPHAAGSQDAARSRERITRRISDESIYDSITRLGVSGDRVSIKF